MERRQQSRATALITAAAVLFLFVPLVLVVLFSFHSTGGLSFPFRGFSLRWYDEIFSSHELRAATVNSLIVSTSTSLITLVAGTLAAYGLSRTASRLRGPLALLFFLPITLPGLFLGLALLVSFSRLQIKLSLTTVTVAHLVYVFPYYVLISRAALDRLDRGLEEVAADLGANAMLVFRRVTLPQIWPVLLGATCLAFALSFDEFVITFFVVGEDSTLPLFIWSRLRRTIDPSINAVSTLLLLSTLLLFALAFVLALRGERLRSGRTASL
ncbi:MAG TPA: ABC transporter permease [Candidatus Limnocylindrales bacterium]|nr:ABC transporter permease [Candidatus Limnocylindrales bacterium]